MPLLSDDLTKRARERRGEEELLGVENKRAKPTTDREIIKIHVHYVTIGGENEIIDCLTQEGKGALGDAVALFSVWGLARRRGCCSSTRSTGSVRCGAILGESYLTFDGDGLRKALDARERESERARQSGVDEKGGKGWRRGAGKERRSIYPFRHPAPLS